MKRLEDFPIKADPNTKPLHIVYSCVTFSELSTFDLMRLLCSFRRFNNDLFEYPAHYIGSSEYIKEFIHQNSSHYNNDPALMKKAFFLIKETFDFADAIQSHRKRMKYYQALKKELSKRPHLSRFEKSAAEKKSYC